MQNHSNVNENWKRRKKKVWTNTLIENIESKRQKNSNILNLREKKSKDKKRFGAKTLTPIKYVYICESFHITKKNDETKWTLLLVRQFKSLDSSIYCELWPYLLININQIVSQLIYSYIIDYIKINAESEKRKKLKETQETLYIWSGFQLNMLSL